MEPVFDSIIETYYKLRKLGLQEVNGKIEYRRYGGITMNLYTSTLHDEKTFYRAFIHDLQNCTKEVIIESPFITTERMETLWPVLRKLYSGGSRFSYVVAIIIVS